MLDGGVYVPIPIALFSSLQLKARTLTFLLLNKLPAASS
jgi:hypothetical protein